MASPGRVFKALLGGLLSPLDLRIGASFSGDAAAALHAALRDTSDTIARMPAHSMTYPGGDRPILPVTRLRGLSPSGGMTIEAARLWSYGEMRVPAALWRALQRYAAWVEPSLTAEWIRLMRGYAASQSRTLDEGRIAAAMTWADPARDVAVSRAISLAMLQSGHPVRCVWTGAALTPTSLDIDHAFPWAAWPCGDLWNLLPSEAALQRARTAILHWWEAAYLTRQDALPRRFSEEAQASLPGLDDAGQETSPEAVFAAMGLQRLHLHLDQGVPEWTG